MQRVIAPIPCRPWTLNGLSERLIVSHYENNYGGAVRAANAIQRDLAALDLATTPGHLLRSLEREALSANNSIALHELYFENLGGDGKITPGVAAALDAQWGRVDIWRKRFIAAAQALRGGSGWVVLARARDGRLANHVAVDHTQSVVDSAPLLVLDMYEHAYHIDFGANATAYIDAFMRNVDWSVVERRLDQASGKAANPATLPAADLPSVSIEELSEQLANGERLQLLDARPRHYYSRSTDMMQDAIWRDPTRVAEWSHELAADTPVYVYCAYGFHVGCGVTAELRERGFDARYVRGGLSAWWAAGGKRSLIPAAVPTTDS